MSKTSRLLSSKLHHWGHAMIGVPILISGLCVLKLPETFNRELPQTLRAARKISTIAIPQTAPVAQEMKDVENWIILLDLKKRVLFVFYIKIRYSEKATKFKKKFPPWFDFTKVLSKQKSQTFVGMLVFWILLLNFNHLPAGKKLLKNKHTNKCLALLILSVLEVISNQGRRFFQILWPSHNVQTLPEFIQRSLKTLTDHFTDSDLMECP